MQWEVELKWLACLHIGVHVCMCTYMYVPYSRKKYGREFNLVDWQKAPYICTIIFAVIVTVFAMQLLGVYIHYNGPVVFNLIGHGTRASQKSEMLVQISCSCDQCFSMQYAKWIVSCPAPLPQNGCRPQKWGLADNNKFLGFTDPAYQDLGGPIRLLASDIVKWSVVQHTEYEWSLVCFSFEESLWFKILEEAMAWRWIGTQQSTFSVLNNWSRDNITC